MQFQENGLSTGKCTLENMLDTCSALEDILSNSFGPNSANALLHDNCGKLILSAQSVAILNAIKVQDPRDKTLVAAALAFYKQHGNGGKSFVMFLHRLLRHLTFGVTQAKGLQHLQSFKLYFLNQLLSELRVNCYVTCSSNERDKIRETASNIVRTSLQGKLFRNLHDIVSSLVLKLAFTKDVLLNVCIDETIDCFDDIVIDVAPRPVTDSRVLEGIIIQRDLLVHCPRTLLACNAVVVVLHCDITVESDLNLQYQGSVSDWLQFKARLLQQFVQRLAQHNVSLLLVRGKASEALAEYCKKADVSVIHYVSDDDVARLQRYTGIQPVDAFTDVVDANCRATVSSCSLTDCYGVKGVLLSGFSNSSNHTAPPRHILLCAPSQGMCRQIASLILASFKVLRAWLTPPTGFDKTSESHLYHHVAGGAAFELTLCRAINTLLATAPDISCDMRDALTRFVTSLYDIPLLLVRNSYGGGTRHRLTSIDLQRISSKPRDNDAFGNLVNTVVGVNAKSGVSFLSEDTCVIEPASSKVQMVLDAIDVAIQLVRIDASVT